MNGKRAHRNYTGREVVLALARHGVAISTMSRALLLGEVQVTAWCNHAFEVGELIRMPPAVPEDIRGAMATELVHLRAQLSEANDLIREMRTVDTDVTDALQGVARMSHGEAVVLASIVRHGRVSKQRLYNALYGNHANPDATPDPKIIDVFICKIRRKLEPHEIEIGTLWGWGYQMTPENVDKLRALAGMPTAAVPAAPPALDVAA